MRKELKKILAVCLGMAVLPVGAQPQNRPAPPPSGPVTSMTNKQEELSYAIGMNVGANLKRMGGEVDVDILIAALKDALAGKDMKMTEQQMMQVLRNNQREMMAKRQEEQHKMAEKNRKAGEEFLAENKKKEGVKALDVKMAEGNTVEMQYKVLTEGSGSIPKSNDMVTVLYRGTLLNGKEFDAATNAATPRKFPLSSPPVRGWSDALQMMKTGSKSELWVPSPLAFGDYGRPNVEPGSLVVYELELVGAEPAPQAAVPAAPQPLTSDIIRVPSAEELKAGAKPEVIKAEEVERLKAAAEKEQKKP